MNVAEMLKNVKAECHPITNIDAYIIRCFDRGQKVVGSKYAFSWLRQYRYTLATVANQEFYAFSPLVNTSKIITIYEPAASQSYGGMTEMEFRRYEPNPQAGTPFLYRFVGFSPVQNQPSAAATIDIVSDSASDAGGGAVIVTVQGLDASSVYQVRELTTNGLVTVSSPITFTKILGLSKNAASVGTITASVTIGAPPVTTTLVAIAPKDRAVSHPILGFYNIPNSVRTLYYDFTMKLPTITALNDNSLIPEQYHDVIEVYAKWQVFKHLNNPTMASACAQEMALRIEDMKNDDYTPEGVWTLNEYHPNQIQLAQLPSNFPRDDT